MAIEIIVPRLGWSMEEGAFVAWLKQDGAYVTAGEPLFSIEGDKAVQEIESIDSGVLRIAQNGPKAGDLIRVGDILGHLVSKDEAAPKPVARAAAAPVPKPASSKGQRAANSSTVVAQVPAKLLVQPKPALTISPRALRLAAELGVDWVALNGSGRTGRIREKDIRLAAAGSTRSGGTLTRQVIAERMITSLHRTAPVTLHTRGCASALVKLRNQLKAAASKSGAVVPSYTEMFVKLAATALAQHPALNARWEGDKLVASAPIHVGMAVDTEAGLLVPVIRDVGRLSLAEIACRARELSERARQKALTADEMRGGTFTVTSLGAFGIDAFTPIIHYPECAILGVGRIDRQAVVAGDEIVAREVVTLSLTFDHRALDGAPAARFLETLRGLMEDEPTSWSPS